MARFFPDLRSLFGEDELYKIFNISVLSTPWEGAKYVHYRGFFMSVSFVVSAARWDLVTFGSQNIGCSGVKLHTQLGTLG